MNVNGGMSYSQIRQQMGDSFAKYLDEMDGVQDGQIAEEALNKMLDEFATMGAGAQSGTSFDGVGGAGYQMPVGVPPMPGVAAPGMNAGMYGAGMMNPMMMGMYGWSNDPAQGQQLATMQALGSHMMSSGVGGGMMMGGGMAGIGMMGAGMANMGMMGGMMGGMPATAHAYPVVAGGNAQFYADANLEGSLKGLDGKVAYLQNVMSQAAQTGDMKTMQEAGIQLQKYMQMQQVLTQMLTNVMKMQHDISKSIIGNIR